MPDVITLQLEHIAKDTMTKKTNFLHSCNPPDRPNYLHKDYGRSRHEYGI